MRLAEGQEGGDNAIQRIGHTGCLTMLRRDERHPLGARGFNEWSGAKAWDDLYLA